VREYLSSRTSIELRISYIILSCSVITSLPSRNTNLYRSVTALRKGNCAFSIFTQYPVFTYQNSGEDRNENTILQNANEVCFGHLQGECFSFGQVLLFIRGVRTNSEKRLIPSTCLSVCPSAYRRGRLL
jgi:hypothetical protein